MTPTIGVLGLGAMGLPMVRHRAQSFPIRSYDIDVARCSAATDSSTARLRVAVTEPTLPSVDVTGQRVGAPVARPTAVI